MNANSALRLSNLICSFGFLLFGGSLQASDSEFVFVGDEQAPAALTQPTRLQPVQLQPEQSPPTSDLGIVVGDVVVEDTPVQDRFVAPESPADVGELSPVLPASARGELTVKNIPNPYSSAPKVSEPAVGVEKPIAKPVITAPPELGEVEQLLIDAHTASQEAATVTDYSEVIDQCIAAIKAGAFGENQEFATTLISWALNRRGQIYADEDKPELATADFQEAVHFDPNNWRALHNRGVSSAEAGHFADAFDDFNRVIELNPKFAKAFTNRATLYVQAGDLASAEQDYKRACRLDGQLASARLGLARACHMAGRWDEALQHFTVASKIDPENPGILCSRGDLLSDMGRYGEALSDYATAIELKHDFAHAYRNGAWLLATCPVKEYRDAENAIVGAKQALEFDYGERYVALDTLAAALANNGQFEEAVATLEEALELAPSALRVEYLSRIKLYESGQPFRTQPVAKLAQASYAGQ